MKLLCTVYKSAKMADTYLFVQRAEGLERVPPELLEQFGEPEEVLTFKLTPERKLAIADPARVFGELQEQGYYLQMPPRPEVLGSLETWFA